MHHWHDDFDWKGLEDALEYLERRLRQYGFDVYAKEKWGEARVTIYFWNHFYQKTWVPIWLTRPVHFIQAILYYRVYVAAVDIWPHLASEMLAGAEYLELLRPLAIQNKFFFITSKCSVGHVFLKDGHCEYCFKPWQQERDDNAISD